MKLNIYYHIWAPVNDYLIKFLIDEQMKRLRLHSLTDQAKLNVVVVGKAANDIASYVKKYDGAHIRNVVTDEDGWELHTLKVIHDDCRHEPNQYVMYMHTKGLSHYYNSKDNPQRLSWVNTWRHFMESVCIDEWRECVKDLSTYDAVGMNLYSQPFPHFSGNFWWATGKHIIKLNDPFKYKDVNPAPDRPGVTNRHQAEAWIGAKKCRLKTRRQITGSMYSSDKFGEYKITV